MPPSLQLYNTGDISSGAKAGITGTPSAAGTYTFTIKVTDSTPSSSGGPYTASQSYTVMISGSGAGFTISASPASQTVSASGGSAKYTVSVQSTSTTNPFTGTVTLSASGVPTGANWLMSQLTVTPGASGATPTMTIVVPQTTGATTCNASVRSYSPFAFALLLLPVLLIGKARKLRIGGLLLAVLTFGTIAGVTGCGGGGNGGNKCTPTTGTNAVQTGTYTITITGNDSSHTAKVTLVVQ